MNLNIDYDDTTSTEYNFDDEDIDIEISEHHRDVRRRLEDRLERRRLKHELEDFDGELDDEFEWNEES